MTDEGFVLRDRTIFQFSDGVFPDPGDRLELEWWAAKASPLVIRIRDSKDERPVTALVFHPKQQDAMKAVDEIITALTYWRDYVASE